MLGKVRHMKRHKWTDEERVIVRRDYKGTHSSANEIGRRLGVTQYAVAGQVNRLGIATRSDRHPWDPKQDDQLRKLIPCYAPQTVAKKMHRSINSVVVRSKRLGLSRRSRNGWFTKSEACSILGVDHHWLQRRIDSGQLKATYHNGRRPSNIGLAMWHIEQQDLKTFIRRYPQDLNGRNVDIIAIVEILAGLQ